MDQAAHDPTRVIALSQGRTLPLSILRFSAARSGGPGGQNVNKTATKVQLRVSLTDLAAALGAEAAGRLQVLFQSRITAEGEVVIVCDESRSQHANRQTCVARLTALLNAALRRPPRRVRTKPTRASRLRRVAHKRQRSALKRQRGARDHDQ